MSSYLTSEIAPWAPFPDAERSAVARHDAELRAIAGRAIALTDRTLIRWVLDDLAADVVLDHHWRDGEMLDGAACERLVRWVDAGDSGGEPYLDTAVSLIFMGEIIAATCVDPVSVRAAHHRAARRLLAARRAEWEAYDPATCNSFEYRSLLSAMQDLVESPWRRRPGSPGAITAALAQTEADCEKLIALSAAGEWIGIDRHLVTDDWYDNQSRAMRDVVQRAVAEGVAHREIAVQMARVAMLLGDVRYAEAILASDVDERAALGALLVSYLVAPEARQNIYGVMCAVHEIGVTGTLATEYGARLPGACTRGSAGRSAQAGHMVPVRGLDFAGWQTQMRACLETDGAPDGLLPGVAMWIAAQGQHAMGACALENIGPFRALEADGRFLGWELHVESVLGRIAEMTPYLAGTFGAEIDGHWRTATAVFRLPLSGQPAMPQTDDEQVIRDAAWAWLQRAEERGINVAGLDAWTLPLRAREVPGNFTPPPRPARPVVLADIDALLGTTPCAHRTGTWSDNAPGCADWTPERVPADAAVFTCDACARVVDVVPLHRAAGESNGAYAVYLARENVYRALHSLPPARTVGEVLADNGDALILTRHGACDVRRHDAPIGSVCDLAGALFG